MRYFMRVLKPNLERGDDKKMRIYTEYIHLFLKTQFWNHQNPKHDPLWQISYASLSIFYFPGKIGDWINYYTRPMMEDFNALIEEKLKGTGLEFDDGLDAIREELHKRQDKHQ